MAKKKQNTDADDPIGQTPAHNQLSAYRDRIMNLLDERAALNDDIKEIYAEAKGNGLNVKVLRKAISEYRRSVTDAEKWREEDTVLSLYLSAFGLDV